MKLFPPSIKKTDTRWQTLCLAYLQWKPSFLFQGWLLADAPYWIVHTGLWHIGCTFPLHDDTKDIGCEWQHGYCLLTLPQTKHSIILLSMSMPPLHSFFPLLSHSSTPWNLARPSMFKTHYMWPSGIYSGALPVTPFHAGVPWEHGEMSSCKAWKRRVERDSGREVVELLREQERQTLGNVLETNTFGIICSSRYMLWRRQVGISVCTRQDSRQNRKCH